MPQRSFKSMFIEIVSFLTLFALIGTMTSNFWERYLIQSELSNIKSSLHILKEHVYNIGAAYDNLHHELNGLVQINTIKSAKSLPKELCSNHRNSDKLNSITSLMFQEIENTKDKIVGITATKGTNCYDRTKSLKSSLKNVTTTTRNPLKSTGINVSSEPSKTARSNDHARRTNTHKCCNEDDCCEDENSYRKF